MPQHEQPAAKGRLLFRVHRGGAELRPATRADQDELSDLPDIEDGVTFVTAQLHGKELRVTVGATATLNGNTPVNREFEITDKDLLKDIHAALQELQDYSAEYTLAQVREDARVTHNFNKSPMMQETFRDIRRAEKAQEDK